MIDILLPFYGDPRLMREAVESVLAQRSHAWHLYVVDDATPGQEVGAWLRRLGHPQVTYLRNRQRLGVRGNFERAAELGTRPWVTFMGCDDVMEPWYVGHVQSLIARHPDAAAVQPRVTVIDDAGEVTRPLADRVKHLIDPVHDRAVVLDGEALLTRLLLGNWLYFPAITWDRDSVLAHPFRLMDTALDLGLLADLAFEGKAIALSPTAAFRYRRHRASASSRTARSAERFAEERALTTEIRWRCDQAGWRKASVAARLRLTSRMHAAQVAVRTLTQGEGRAGAALLRHALS